MLKLTVGSLLSSMGMKPNFIIAMYCLAIILTRPKLGQALVIGLLAGLICQIPLLNATPLLNIPSEVLGALACGLLIKVPLRIGGKLDLNPLVNTFVSTAWWPWPRTPPSSSAPPRSTASSSKSWPCR